MSLVGDAAALQGIDAANVRAWLAANVAGAVAPFSFDLIAGGRSNLTFRVTGADGTRYVLRRPPVGLVLATAHDMAREHRLISAMGQTNVPVPACLGLCTDPAVNGADFYVMAFVDGVVLDTPDRAAAIAMPLRRQISENLVDVLADLHAVDVDAVGLGNLAKREGYIERQVKRWSAQWAASKTFEISAVDEVAAYLQSHVPVQQGVSIAHGDYRLGNCLTDTATGRIAAVLDWELCTLGDPLADVGYLGVWWSDGSGSANTSTDVTQAGGFLTYAEVVDRYARRTGRDVSQVDFYVAFGCWRLAVINAGVYARYLGGAMGEKLDDATLDDMKYRTKGLAEKALAATKRLG
jgi:aminoglycoside phosphotransferase (APT) family kinase protein